jgi:hypothetical protein
MVVLIFFACLATSEECRKVEVVWYGTMHECALFGQQMLVSWEREHPEYVRQGWHRCSVGRAT